ncbi:hypothetical protein DSOUD_1550 [Desulfuromonas soudanensis]|uniref:Uncharacterized protein n=1 Tax=Desulfuromonas soudanensis TaxID=1603606 RepID=A0A0M3QFJ3_9BACT|nr:hypothetical protein [Desulfuromonas soudanensis]ALC16329.1 hypothetical protein DSOUD_1550 [Desulfuromonas soudanensis]
MYFREGENCYRFSGTNRIAVLVDCAIYYRVVAGACEFARQAIYILGWDVDSRIRLRRGEDGDQETLGQFLD